MVNPHDTMRLQLWEKKHRPINCDGLFLLRIFARLTDVGTAAIHPSSGIAGRLQVFAGILLWCAGFNDECISSRSEG